jgi:hypothetical protein
MVVAIKANAHQSWPPIVTKKIVSIHQYVRVNKIYNRQDLRLYKHIVHRSMAPASCGDIRHGVNKRFLVLDYIVD